MKKPSKKKAELIKWLNFLLTNYKERIAFHCNKEKLDEEINYIVETLKEID